MKTMKKNFWMLGMMFVTLFGFTSCEYELAQAIGYEVSGRWFGDMDMYINGTKCYDSEIEFMPQGWGYRKGRGVEVDHLWSYHITHYFDYEILNGAIYLYFDDPELDCVIRDYRIDDQYFTGYMDGAYDCSKFRLKNYEHFRNEWGYNDYFYAKADKGFNDVWDEDCDSLSTDSIASVSLSDDKIICSRGINKAKD